MKNNLSRQELKDRLQRESLFTIYLTAFFFICAGSLWMNLSLKNYFWNPWLVSSWLTLHVSCLMSLRYKERSLLYLSMGLGIFQLYCYFLSGQGLPFIPLAPLFFTISALSLASSWNWDRPKAAAFWALCWLSALSWSKPFYWDYAQGRNAVFLTVSIHAVFHFTFIYLASLYSRRQNRFLQDMFGKFSYDTQRIHAGRLQLLGELSASLAHEISGSILNIHGYQYQLNEEIKELKVENNIITSTLDRLDKNIQHVMNVVRALRSFSRKEIDKPDSQCSLTELVQESVELTHEHLKIAKVQMTWEIPEKDHMIQGSKVELEQIIINFLINARDACMKSPIKKVSLHIEETPDSFGISITDSGGGVPEDIKIKIFEPFFTTKESTHGTGLGLYLCRMIAQRQNAELRILNVSDENSSGARFELWVKKAQAKASYAA
ncbi:MAG: HAMP domain-containing histidine kinase [Proteobacteria bacterium]|nr:HAMP domain-containing histidine kinase [Pseudomonadota bacterium]